MASRWNAQYFKADDIIGFVNFTLAEAIPGAQANALKSSDGDDFVFDGRFDGLPIYIVAKARAAAPGAMNIVGLAILGSDVAPRWSAETISADALPALLTTKDRLFTSFGEVEDGHMSRVRDDFFESWAERLPYGDAIGVSMLAGEPFSQSLHATGLEPEGLPKEFRSDVCAVARF